MIANLAFRLLFAVAATTATMPQLFAVVSLADPSQGARLLARQQAPATPAPATQPTEGEQQKTQVLAQSDRLTAMANHR